MPAKVFSAAVMGLSGQAVEVEADILGSGAPNFTLVGLPDAAVKESRNRVEAALKNSGFEPPYRAGRVTVNLAPADMPKAGPLYDLPIAAAYLLASGQASFVWKKKLFVGELALDGIVRPVGGALPIALSARDMGFEEIYVPAKNAPEASVVSGIRVFGVETLIDTILHLEGKKLIEPEPSRDIAELFTKVSASFDMSEVRGQETAKRALEVAAAGGHNVLLTGSPGSGKTMLARAAASILPKFTEEECLEVTKIFSVSGLLRNDPIVKERPFRAPHHSASAAALVGGGTLPRPGEISLAHRGVLFLDEFAEFPRTVLEMLRQPLEDGFVTVSRAKGTLSFPARFILVAAMNPCPCGNAGDIERLCSCDPGKIVRYQQKISGPILDRIDLQIDVPRVKVEALQEHRRTGETSNEIRERVEKARAVQRERFVDSATATNGEMSTKEVQHYCALNDECLELMRKAISSLKLSARGYFRIIKVSRTIADLSESEHIQVEHIAEALQYRFRSE